MPELQGNCDHDLANPGVQSRLDQFLLRCVKLTAGALHHILGD